MLGKPEGRLDLHHPSLKQMSFQAAMGEIIRKNVDR
jgi:hypothetical protein